MVAMSSPHTHSVSLSSNLFVMALNRTIVSRISRAEWRSSPYEIFLTG